MPWFFKTDWCRNYTTIELHHKIRKNYKLHASKRTSNTQPQSVSEFVRLISSHITVQIVSEVEFNDICIFQQYVTSIWYVDAVG